MKEIHKEIHSYARKTHKNVTNLYLQKRGIQFKKYTHPKKHNFDFNLHLQKRTFQG